MGEDLVEFFKVDFKDKLSYRGLGEDIKEYSNLQKWIIYKSYKNKDADIIIKKNKQLRDALGWGQYKYFDCIFTLGTYFGLICRQFPNENYNASDVRNMKPDKDFDIYNVLDKKAIIDTCPKLSEKQLDRLASALSGFARSTHTIGNYMPCPDSKYNKEKGFPMTRYNDRIELLYDSSSEYKKWFDEDKNKKILHLEEILNNQELKKLPCQKNVRKLNIDNIPSLIEWMEKVNALIQKRTNILFEEYRKWQKTTSN